MTFLDFHDAILGFVGWHDMPFNVLQQDSSQEWFFLQCLTHGKIKGFMHSELAGTNRFWKWVSLIVWKKVKAFLK